MAFYGFFPLSVQGPSVLQHVSVLLFVAKQYSVLRTHHILCIRSSVDGYLGLSFGYYERFYELNIKFLREHTFSVLLAVYLGVELLGHVVTLYLIFEELTNSLFNRVFIRG